MPGSSEIPTHWPGAGWIPGLSRETNIWLSSDYFIHLQPQNFDIVETQDDFIIPFKGLAIGEHSFHYEIDAAFFAELEYAELQNAEVSVDLQLERQERMLILDFDIRGSIEVECDRCLEPFPYAVEGQRQLIIQFGDHYEEEDDDIIVIPFDDHQIDITHHLYDYLLLMLPIKRVHPEGVQGKSSCNPDMLRKLERLSGQTGNDPRWDALNDLKKKWNDQD
jgi:uncharacterized metal-binding protein YceD (DUF177 family)